MNNNDLTTYKNWKIRVHTCEFACSSFSFDLTDPCNKTRRVPFPGKTREEAMEKAREMIDKETASSDPTCSN